MLGTLWLYNLSIIILFLYFAIITPHPIKFMIYAYKTDQIMLTWKSERITVCQEDFILVNFFLFIAGFNF